MLLPFFLLSISSWGQSQKSGTVPNVREPAVAGQFYPDNPKELSDYVDTLVANAIKSAKLGDSPWSSGQSPNEIIGLLVPHAGYPFSGQVAAHAYKTIAGKKFDTIVIVGTAHYGSSKPAIYPKGVFKTPLGNVKVDEEFTKALLDRFPKVFEASETAHRPEHSIEVQLPFLQKILSDFSIVPIVIGDIPLETSMGAGDAIAQIIEEGKAKGKSALVIASTDLSHYPSQKDAVKADHEILTAVQSFNPKTVWDADKKIMKEGIPNLACTMCGSGAAIAVMEVAKKLGAGKTEILKYANSADVPFGSPDRVVGYAAVVFLSGNDPASSVILSPSIVMLSEAPAAMRRGLATLFGGKHLRINSAKNLRSSDPSPAAQDESVKNQKHDLLQLSRRTLEEFVKSGKEPKIEAGSGEAKAVFITLMKSGELRGCIGSPEPVYPLEAAVRKYTIDAASHDPRFLRVKPEELSQIKIEVSILTPMTKVKNVDDIVPMRDGVVIERGAHRGLFLPQVWEILKTKEEFLSRLADEKAGLPPDAWKSADTNLYTFQVEKFGEAESP